jgi:S1-C subfamily serine protease
VPQGAAEVAGLEPGDIVLAVDGKPIDHSRQLTAVVFQHVFGEEIKLDIQRGKEQLKKTVAVLARPRSPEDLEELANRDAHLVRRLGVLALTLDEKVTPILPDLRRLSGVAVAGVPAEFAGLNPGLIAGDVIYELNGSRIGTLEELRTALDGNNPAHPLRFLSSARGS